MSFFLSCCSMKQKISLVIVSLFFILTKGSDDACPSTRTFTIKNSQDNPLTSIFGERACRVKFVNTEQAHHSDFSVVYRANFITGRAHLSVGNGGNIETEVGVCDSHEHTETDSVQSYTDLVQWSGHMLGMYGFDYLVDQETVNEVSAGINHNHADFSSGNTDIFRCPENTYNDVQGGNTVSDCIPCPKNSVTNGLTGATSTAACVCPPPYILHGSSQEEASCQCAPGFYCPEEKTMNSVLDAVVVQDDVVREEIPSTLFNFNSTQTSSYGMSLFTKVVFGPATSSNYTANMYERIATMINEDTNSLVVLSRAGLSKKIFVFVRLHENYIECSAQSTQDHIFLDYEISLQVHVDFFRKVITVNIYSQYEENMTLPCYAAENERFLQPPTTSFKIFLGQSHPLDTLPRRLRGHLLGFYAFDFLIDHSQSKQIMAGILHGSDRANYTVRDAPQACPQDTYNEAYSSTRREECLACMSGKNTRNKTAIDKRDKCQCINGTYADDEHSPCFCDEGHYCTFDQYDDDDHRIVQGCPRGQYNDQQHRRSCTRCAADTFSDEIASTACTPCPDGFSTMNRTGCHKKELCIQVNAPEEKYMIGHNPIKNLNPFISYDDYDDRVKISATAVSDTSNFSFSGKLSLNTSSLANGSTEVVFLTRDVAMEYTAFFERRDDVVVEYKVSVAGGYDCTVSIPVQNFGNEEDVGFSGSLGLDFADRIMINLQMETTMGNLHRSLTCFKSNMISWADIDVPNRKKTRLSGLYVFDRSLTAEQAFAVRDNIVYRGKNDLVQGEYESCSEGHLDVGGLADRKFCKCGKGKTRDENFFCKFCSPGKFKNVSGNGKCTSCEPGKYSFLGNSSLCLTCPDGKTSRENSNDLDSCTCLPGYQGWALQDCVQCEPGKYSDENSEGVCRSCPTATYTPDSGAKKCVSCPAGAVTSNPASTTPRNCVCDRGYYQQQRHANDTVQCAPCEVDKFNSNLDSLTCLSCPLGKHSLSASDECYMPESIFRILVSVESVTADVVASLNLRHFMANVLNVPMSDIFFSLLPDPTASGFVFNATIIAHSQRQFREIIQVLSVSSALRASFLGVKNTCPDKAFPSVDENGHFCQSCPIDRTGHGLDCGLWDCWEEQIFEVREPIPAEHSAWLHYNTETHFSLIPNEFEFIPYSRQFEVFFEVPGAASGACDSREGKCTETAKFITSGLQEQSECCKVDALSKASAVNISKIKLRRRGFHFDSNDDVTACRTINLLPNTISITTQKLCDRFLPFCGPCGPGEFSGQLDSDSCSLCSARTASATPGSAFCTVCEPGKFQELPGKSVCVSCVPGKYSTGNSTSCLPCEVGTYAADPAATTCRTCPAGKIQKNTASAKCSDCYPGFFSNLHTRNTCIGCPRGFFSSLTSSSHCDVCTRGKFQPFSNSSYCHNCLPGLFQNRTGSTDCSFCSPGFFSGMNGSAVCAACLPGKYSNVTGASQCKNCTAGFSQENKSSLFCVGCPVGTFSNEGAARCENCSPGKFQALSLQGSCELCLPGKYQNFSGQTMCHSCTSGFFSEKEQPTCTACPVGKFSAENESAYCTYCRPGEFQNMSSSTHCLVCPVGMFSSSNRSSNCSFCSVGKFSARANQSACTNCSAGSFQSLTGQTQCQNCSFGEYSGDGMGACLACPVGKFQDEQGQDECLLCSPGTYQNMQNQTSCKDCLAGKFSSVDGLAECGICPPGSYQKYNSSRPYHKHTHTFWHNVYTAQFITFFHDEHENMNRNHAENCDLCPTGSYQPHNGSSACLVCSVGKFQNLSGQIECHQCSAGKYQPLKNSTLCLNCVPGKAQETLGSSDCEFCPAGKISAQYGSHKCSVCPPGTYSSENASTCLKCVPGTYQASNNSKNCTLCPPGSISNHSMGITCHACAAGMYTNISKPTVCIPCQPGTARDANDAGECTFCLPGFFSATERAVACQPCGPGTFQSQTAQTFCHDCPAGKAQDLNASVGCVPCLPGTYSEKNASRQCLPCEAGTYQTHALQTFCLVCIAGNAQPANGSMSCDSCLPGSYSNSNMSTTCTLCSPGKFQDHDKATTCVPCALGTFQNNSGQTECIDCRSGHFQNKTGSRACLRCSPGTYQPYNNSDHLISYSHSHFYEEDHVHTPEPKMYATTCLLCSPGTYQPLHGAHTCITCPIGKFSYVNASTECFGCPTLSHFNYNSSECQCDLGAYRADTGDCELCEAGTYKDFEGDGHCIQCPFETFNPRVGSISDQNCSECMPESYTILTGRIGIVECVCFDGLFHAVAPNGTHSCKPCFPSTDDVIFSGSRPCSPCQGGYSVDQTQNGDCVLCRAGSYSTQGSYNCTPCMQHATSQPLLRPPSSLNHCECNPGFHLASMGVCLGCVEGKFKTNIGNSECLKCPAGKFANSTNSSQCLQCDAGKYQNFSGTTNCLQCSAGKFSMAGLSSCLDCPAGSYAASNSSAKCDKCAVGMYQNRSGTTMCIECHAGSYQERTGKSKCDLCRIGSFQNETGQSSCIECTFGKFQNMFGHSVCFDCHEGKYQPFNSSIRTFYYGRNKSYYTNIDIYDISNFKHSLYHAGSCDRCEAGKYQPGMGASACLLCAPGNFSDRLAQTTCKQCLSGKFQNNPGFSHCFDCPLGTFQKSIAQTACVSCTVGYFKNFTGSVGPCYACPAGTYSNTNQTSQCSQCAPGKFQNDKGETDCRNCTPGLFAPNSGHETCDVCPFGKFQTTFSASVCKNCSAGSYTAGFNTTSCILCKVGYFQRHSGQSTCERCPIGYKSEVAGATGCQKCDEGSCLNCDAGEYHDANDATICFKCPPGKFQNDTGQDDCKQCRENTVSFAGSVSQDECKCKPGFGLDEMGECVVCELGTYKEVAENEPCSLCPSNSFNNKTGGNATESCIACPANYVSSEGSVTQKDCVCKDGSYPQENFEWTIAEQNTDSCDKTCEDKALVCNDHVFQIYPYTKIYASLKHIFNYETKISSAVFEQKRAEQSDTYYPLFLDFSEPRKVLPDLKDYVFYANSEYSGRCAASIDPAVIAVSPIAKRICPCATENIMPRCIECDPGTFKASGKTMGKCNDCLPGTYSDEEASTVCTLCMPGEFQKNVMETTCDACDVGFYQGSYNASTCLSCTSGSFSNVSKASFCHDCQPGKFNENDAETMCDDCSVGTFQPDLRGTHCQVCSAGFYQAASSSSFCNRCSPGSYQNRNRSVDCIECLAGMYQNEYNATTCLNCTSGSFSRYDSASSCDLCSPGTFQPEAQETGCLDCPIGTFQRDSGQDFCNECSLSNGEDGCCPRNSTAIGDGSICVDESGKSCSLWGNVHLPLCPNIKSCNYQNETKVCCPVGMRLYARDESACVSETGKICSLWYNPGLDICAGISMCTEIDGKLTCCPEEMKLEQTSLICEHSNMASCGLTEEASAGSNLHLCYSEKSCVGGKCCPPGMMVSSSGTTCQSALDETCTLSGFEPAPGTLECPQCVVHKNLRHCCPHSMSANAAGYCLGSDQAPCSLWQDASGTARWDLCPGVMSCSFNEGKQVCCPPGMRTYSDGSVCKSYEDQLCALWSNSDLELCDGVQDCSEYFIFNICCPPKMRQDSYFCFGGVNYEYLPACSLLRNDHLSLCFPNSSFWLDYESNASITTTTPAFTTTTPAPNNSTTPAPNNSTTAAPTTSPPPGRPQPPQAADPNIPSTWITDNSWLVNVRWMKATVGVKILGVEQTEGVIATFLAGEQNGYQALYGQWEDGNSAVWDVFSYANSSMENVPVSYYYWSGNISDDTSKKMSEEFPFKNEQLLGQPPLTIKWLTYGLVTQVIEVNYRPIFWFSLNVDVTKDGRNFFEQVQQSFEFQEGTQIQSPTTNKFSMFTDGDWMTFSDLDDMFYQDVYICVYCSYIEKLEFHGLPVQIPFVMDFTSKSIKRTYTPIPYQVSLDLIFGVPQHLPGYVIGDLLVNPGMGSNAFFETYEKSPAWISYNGFEQIIPGLVLFISTSNTLQTLTFDDTTKDDGSHRRLMHLSPPPAAYPPKTPDRRLLFTAPTDDPSFAKWMYHGNWEADTGQTLGGTLSILANVKLGGVYQQNGSLLVVISNEDNAEEGGRQASRQPKFDRKVIDGVLQNTIWSPVVWIDAGDYNAYMSFFFYNYKKVTRLKSEIKKKTQILIGNVRAPLQLQGCDANAQMSGVSTRESFCAPQNAKYCDHHYIWNGACKCNKGYTGPDEGVCVACKAGKYKDTVGSADCTDCPDNKPSEKASTSVEDCQCDKGQTGKHCIDCAAGKYKNFTGSGPCVDCDIANGFTSEPGSKYATDCQCDRGYYLDETSCALCEPGKYKDTMGSGSCDACPEFSQSVAGSTSSDQCECDAGYEDVQDSGICRACSYGKFKKYSGNTECLDCPQNSESATSSAATECFCNKGYTGENSKPCTACIPGKYKSIVGSALCSDCPENSTSSTGAFYANECECKIGYSSFQQLTPSLVGGCFMCEAGKFKDTVGQSSCFPCAQHSTSFPPAAECFCVRGFEGLDPLNDMTGCKRCQPGTYKNTIGGICQPCPNSGFTSPEASTKKTDCLCDKGHFGNSCSQCPSGKYKDVTGNFSCTDCNDRILHRNSPAGSDEEADCVCNAGYTLQAEMCNECAKGKYKNEEGNQACSACSGHAETSLPGSTSVQDCVCDLGFAGWSVCTECDVGTYKTVIGRNTSLCLACHDFSSSDAGSDEKKDCTCNKGYFGKDGIGCTACPPGKFKEMTGDVPCFSCDLLGSNRNSTPASTSIQDCRCRTGWSDFYTGGGECQSCVAGKYKSIMGSSECIDCPRASFSNLVGSPHPDFCNDCPTYSDSERASTTIYECVCNSGYSGHDGENCTLCTIGEYEDLEKNECMACDKGKTSPAASTSKDQCLEQCLPGFTGPDGAIEECTPCERGKFKSAIGSGECTGVCPKHTDSEPGASSINDCKCNFGYTAANDGVACGACAAGKYKNFNGSLPCRNCARGKYSGSFAAVSPETCIACPPNSFSIHENSTNVHECLCKPGFHGTENGICFKCDLGKYKETTAYGSCLLCTDGKYLPFYNATSASDCRSCPLNSSSTPDRSQCLCDLGHTGPNTDSATLQECVPCAANTFKDIIGSSACSSCHDFSVSPNGSTNASACVCDFGYTRGAAPQKCIPCDHAFFKNFTGDESCLACPLNKSTHHLASRRQRDCICDRGFTVSGQYNQTCQACPRNRYKNIKGEGTCELCPLNTITLKEASGDIEKCICKEGYHAEQNGVNCSGCSAGKFKDVPGTSPCQTCRNNSVSEAASRRCECDAGFFENKPEITCLACERNTFKNATGPQACTRCHPHSRSPPQSISRDMCECDAGFNFNLEAFDVEETCEQCAVGKYKSVIANYQCQACNIFKNTVSRGNTKRSDCLCIPGFTLLLDELSTESGTCQECEIGKFKPGPYPSNNPCTPCPSNMSSAPGSTRYQDCQCLDDGSSENKTCAACLVGSHVVDPDTGVCLKCPHGHVSYDLLGECLPCGDFAVVSENLKSCLCQRGTTKAQDTDTCVFCPSGKFKKESSNSSCTRYDGTRVESWNTTVDFDNPISEFNIFVVFDNKNMTNGSIATFVNGRQVAYTPYPYHYLFDSKYYGMHYFNIQINKNYDLLGLPISFYFWDGNASSAFPVQKQGVPQIFHSMDLVAPVETLFFYVYGFSGKFISNFTNGTANLTNVTTNLTNVTANLTNVTANLTNVTANLTNVTANLTNVTANLTNVTANLTNVTANLTNVTANLTNVTANLTNVTANLTNVTANLTNVTANLTNVTANLTNITRATTTVTPIPTTPPPTTPHPRTIKTQKIHLTSGNSWISFNVFDEGNKNLRTILMNISSAWSNGDFIQGDHETLVFNSGIMGFVGGSGRETMSTDTMYIIYRRNPGTLYYTGREVYLPKYINLYRARNFLPCPYQENVEIRYNIPRLANGREYINGDTIYSQMHGVMRYYKFIGWVGILQYAFFHPGMGYMISLAEQNTIIFDPPSPYSSISSNYNLRRSSRRLLETTGCPEQETIRRWRIFNHSSTSIYDTLQNYNTRESMYVWVRIFIDNVPMEQGHLAAYRGDQLVGVSLEDAMEVPKNNIFPDSGRTMWQLDVYNMPGTSGPVKFKFVEFYCEDVIDLDQEIEFRSYTLVGDLQTGLFVLTGSRKPKKKETHKTHHRHVIRRKSETNQTRFDSLPFIILYAVFGILLICLCCCCCVLAANFSKKKKIVRSLV